MVLRTFSPARAWRPTVVARLARTFGKNDSKRAESLVFFSISYGITSFLHRADVEILKRDSPTLTQPHGRERIMLIDGFLANGIVNHDSERNSCERTETGRR